MTRRTALLPLLVFVVAVSGCVSASTHKQVVEQSNRLKKEKAALEKASEELSNEKKMLTRHSDELEKQRKELKGDLGDVEQKYLDASREATELKGKLEFSTAKIEDLGKQVDKLTKSFEDTRSSLESEHAKALDLGGKLDVSETRVEELKAETESLEKQLAAVKEEFLVYKEDREAEAMKLKVSKDFLEKNLMALETRVKETGTILLEMSGQLSTLGAPAEAAADDVPAPKEPEAPARIEVLSKPAASSPAPAPETAAEPEPEKEEAAPFLGE